MSKSAKSSSIVTKPLKSALKPTSRFLDPDSDEEGEHPDEHEIAMQVYAYNFDNDDDDDFDNSQGTVSGTELAQIMLPNKNPETIAERTKQQLTKSSLAPASGKSSGKYPKITWNPDVTVLEYEVNHGRPFEPTNNEPPQDEKMENLAQKVSDCLLKGIKYEPRVDMSSDGVTSDVKEKLKKASPIQLGVKMTALRGEDMCEAYFTKNNLHLLDDWYYDPIRKKSYLDYAVELTVRKYIELNKGILYNIDYFIQWLLKKCTELMGPVQRESDSHSGGGTKRRKRTNNKRRTIKRSKKRSKKSIKRRTNKKRITKRK